MRTWLWIVLVCLAACQRPPGVSTPSDRTPRRDTALARQLTERGTALAKEGTLQDAQQAFEAAIAADTMHGPAHNNLGLIYYEQDDLYRAAWSFQHAAKLMPYRAEPLNNLGMVYEAAGKLDDAIQQYEQAQSNTPGDPRFLANQARARLRRGDRDATTKGLLEEVALKDTRPDWRRWARDKLATLP